MGVTGSKGVVHYGLLNKTWSEKGLFAKMRKNVLWVVGKIKERAYVQTLWRAKPLGRRCAYLLRCGGVP